jgi:hypothetical protein
VTVGVKVALAEGDGLTVRVGVLVSGMVGMAVRVGGRVAVADAVMVGLAVGVAMALRSGASATAKTPAQ